MLDVGQDTTACNGAHVHTEAAAEAANIILRFGLFPAAKAIWSASATRAVSKHRRSTCAFEDIRFVDGKLTAPGHEPLALT